MSQKIKILLAVLAAVVVLTIGGGVVVMADGTTTTTTSTTTQSNPLLAKVAVILGNGMTEQKLVDAFKQAREQTVKEAITTLLTKALENGTITAADKTAIEKWLAAQPDGTDKETMKAWLEKKPTISKPEFLRRLVLTPARFKRFAYCIGVPLIGGEAVIKKVAVILNISEDTLKNAFQKAAVELRSENFGKALDKAVTNGKLTADEAKQIKSWWAQRPAAFDKLMPDAGTGMWGRIKDGMMRFQQRHTGAEAR